MKNELVEELEHAVVQAMLSGCPTTRVDAAKAALERALEDAARFQWLLAGNGYFMEENFLCGHKPCSEKDQEWARKVIDWGMSEVSKFKPKQEGM